MILKNKLAVLNPKKLLKNFRIWIRQHVIKSRAAFFHIPKTGGTYLFQSKSDSLPVIWPIKYYGHICIIGNKDDQERLPYPYNFAKNPSKEELKKYFVITSVRNIFAWLVSYYGQAGGIKKWDIKINTDHYDYAIAQKGFDSFVRAIAARNDVWPSRRFIFFQIFSTDGELIPDYICRQKTLDNDLVEVADKINLRYEKQAPERVQIKEDYRMFYTKELRELVEKTWGRELRLFGYDFNGFSDTPPLLGKDVTKKDKERIKYDYDKDMLVIDGKVIE